MPPNKLAPVGLRPYTQGTTFRVKDKEGSNDPKSLLKIYPQRPLR